MKLPPAPIITVANALAIAAPHFNNAGIVRNQDMLMQQEDGTLVMRTEVLPPERETLNPKEAAAKQFLLASSESSDSSIAFSDVSCSIEESIF